MKTLANSETEKLIAPKNSVEIAENALKLSEVCREA